MANTVLLEKRTLQSKLLVERRGKLIDYDIPKKAVIGRITSNNSVDIDLEEDFVSRKHAQIGHDDKGYYFIDSYSKNGTYYNGKRLNPEYKQYLNDGDVLHIFNGKASSEYDFICMVFITDYPNSYESGTANLTKDIDEINIGRNGEKSVLMNANTVSSNHASFFAAKEGWAVIDHGSKNGVYLNNSRITNPKYLKVGDCIRISNVHFFFCGDKIVYQKAQGQQAKQAEESPPKNYGQFDNTPLNIHIVERSVWQRTKKLMLLQNIDMTINSGEMVLILGGSGAGKTTFMNAVMGYEKAEGRVLHGETDIYEDFESMKYKIGFVPQQDLLRGSDTVYDTLANAAEMKLPNNVSKEQREKRIEKVLETLGLQRESNSLVSKLSGGQRKRLSIAVEYIADSSLFFLDEPDSGLDGIMAKTLMENLRTIADEGKIVMVISHGPDRAADMFDKVIVLAKSIKDNCGHLAFFGTLNEAYDFFDVDTLEGIVKRINREDEGGDGRSDYYIEKYAKSIV